jgi:hypothetical protein
MDERLDYPDKPGNDGFIFVGGADLGAVQISKALI